MNNLESELRRASGSPKMTAVRFAREHEVKLCQNYGVSRQLLRQQAELIDKQTRVGYVAVPEEEEEPKVKQKAVKKTAKKRSKKKS